MQLPLFLQEGMGLESSRTPQSPNHQHTWGVCFFEWSVGGGFKPEESRGVLDVSFSCTQLEEVVGPRVGLKWEGEWLGLQCPWQFGRRLSLTDDGSYPVLSWRDHYSQAIAWCGSWCQWEWYGVVKESRQQGGSQSAHITKETFRPCWPSLLQIKMGKRGCFFHT